MPLMADRDDRPLNNHRQQLANWLAMLGNREPQTRTIARQGLMSLTPADLPMLREVIAAVPHLTPAQADPLEAIVTYVSARASLQQQPTASEPFLGVSLPIRSAEQMDEQEQTTEIGVPVAGRLFGFVAYRYLQDGDIILAMGRGKEIRPTPTREDLLAVVHTLLPGELITLNLLRGGEMIKVQFALDAKPQIPGDGTMTSEGTPLEVAIDRVRDDAQTYWDTEFRPLVDPTAALSAAAD